MNSLYKYVEAHFTCTSWVIGVVASAIPIYAWLSRSASKDELTLYTIFPLLGLLAFSLMWTHFMIGSIRRVIGLKKPVKNSYANVSMALVLALIIMHPGILWYALFRDGFGLPPISTAIVYENQLVFLMFGSIALTIFLAYELGRWFKNRSWWRLVSYVQAPAMILIFFHALGLGSELHLDWFFIVWLGYGATLIAAVAYNWWYDKNERVAHE